MAMEFASYDEAIARAMEEIPTSAPGERLVYSDINFFLLGEIVHRVSGKTLDEFCRTRIFEPLGMRDTMFKPPASLVPRIAPTERCTQYGWPCDQPGGAMLRGVVHDPTARRMLGVAGHAGLFSTAADLSIFCRMLLDGGRYGAVRILSPMTVAKMTSPVPLPGGQARGLGWDMDSTYSSNRGELLPLGSFGHTGFTGTSLWIDPLTKTWVVFLSNRVHPDGKGDVTPLRAPRRHHRRIGDRQPAVRRPARRAADGRRLRRLGARPGAAAVHAGAERHRRAEGRELQVAPGAQGRPRDQPHGPLDHRRDDDRPAGEGPGHEARGAVQPRARHPRRSRRERGLDARREDRPAGPLALRRDAAADRADARGDRHARLRHRGRRRPLLHLRDDAGVRDGGGGEGEDQGGRARPGEPDQRLPGGGADARQGPAQHGRLLPDAGPPRDDDGRAGEAVQRREQDRRGPDRGAGAGTGSASSGSTRPACRG